MRLHNVCIYSPASAPLLNVQATQASASDPVEVSWSPPSGGSATITGYRIFYDGREILFLPPTDTITGIDLNFGQETKIGQVLLVRAESSMSHLPSELIVVTISSDLFDSVTAIALGVVILIVVLIATVIVIILLIR